MKRLQKVANNREVINKFFNNAKKEIMVNSTNPMILTRETAGENGSEYFGVEFSIDSQEKIEQVFADNKNIASLLNTKEARDKTVEESLQLIKNQSDSFEVLEHTVDVNKDRVDIYIGLTFNN